MKNLAKAVVFALVLSGFSLAQAANPDAPVVAEPQFTHDPVRLGEEVQVTVNAHSPSSSALTYVWSAVSGSIRGQGEKAVYTAPKTYPIAGLDTVTVAVRDSLGRVTTKANVVHISDKGAPGSLRFEPERQSVEAGQINTVKAWLDTGGELVDRVDLVIKYNPNMMEIKNVSVLPLYNEKDQVIVREGRIYVSLEGDPYSGEGALVEISFVGKKVGNTELSFEHLVGDLEDSNLLLSTDELVDLLDEVEVANITIEPGADTGRDDNDSNDNDTEQDKMTPKPKNTPDTGPGLMMVALGMASSMAYILRRHSLLLESLNADNES